MNILYYLFLFFIVLNLKHNLIYNKNLFLKNYILKKKYIFKKYKTKLNVINNLNVGELKIGKIYDVKNNEIFVKLKNDEGNVIIKKENNYLLENELLYRYLFNNNLINESLYNRLLNKKNINDSKTKIKKKIQNELIKNKLNNEVDDCIVLIKEINDKIYGELYTNDIIKRKEKIYDKLIELKNLGNKVLIKHLKNVKNKYSIVLINDCIQGYLLYDKDIHLYNSQMNKQNLVKELSAYIIDVNKKLEYVFLSIKKYNNNVLNQKILEVQNHIILENMFENKYFKAEVIDFTSNGNNLIVKIFENKKDSIKAKIKSNNIINVKNILRNFDYLKNKVLMHELNKYIENDIFKSNKKDEIEKEQKKNKNIVNNTNIKNKNNEKKKNVNKILKKIDNDKLKKYKEEFYGCTEPNALKYINVDNYIYKREKCIYVRIINKTVDINIFEGTMKQQENINQKIYKILKEMSLEENEITNYDHKLRYPSKVLGFFNNYVLLSTKILMKEADINYSKNLKNNINEKKPLNNFKNIITVIEKAVIDYENLKEDDIFFCRFEKIKNQSIRNMFNLPVKTINKMYEYFKKEQAEKNTLIKHNEDKKISHENKLTFEKLFFNKKKIYMMRGELHKDTEYYLNKNNIDKNMKQLKYICDNYYSGFNKSYERFSSIREYFIFTYLGEENYKLYRKLVSDYFSSNKHSYKEILQTSCEDLTSTIFDLVYDEPEKLSIEQINSYNEELWKKVQILNYVELNYLLKDLLKLKENLNTYPKIYSTRYGRINLLLNNEKPIKKEYINTLNVDINIKNELLKKYKNIIFPINYIKELILKKKSIANDKINIIYILADETINIYENSAKDVNPFSEEEIEKLKNYFINKGSNNKIYSKENEENFDYALFDSRNNEMRKILNMIKNDLENQKKRNKIKDVDKYYEEEQKNYLDVTKVHKNIHELNEMNELSKDMFYLKIPFIE